MSEYIITEKQLKTATEAYFEREVPLPITDVFISGDKLPEIVRCRDCEHFNDYHFKCHRPVHIIDAHGNLYWQGEGLMSVTDANPDGFCAWGDRRDA